jgi:2-amino-4-hydroxy-6-hydroxymethyldihydropteridine diphosphokinase
MNQTYLSLGSNLGDRMKNLGKAIILLEELAGHVGAQSSIYETEPWGCSSDLNFYNQVIELHTIQDPLQLLNTIHEIEIRCGRIPLTARYAPRRIDLDILFFNDLIIDTPDLVLPHPILHLRRFVLVPFAEIAPQRIHPLLEKSVMHMLQTCTDDKKVVQLLR